MLKKLICSVLALALALPSAAAIPTGSFEYDAAGRTSAVIEGNGQRHALGYNAWGLVDTYNPPHPSAAGTTQGSVQFGYGPVQRPTSITDPRGLQTTYGYSGRSAAVTATTSPDAGSATYVHDEADNLSQVTTATGAVMTFGYDAENRLHTANYGDALVSFTYHASGAGEGLPALMTDASGSTSFGYDLLGRPTSRTQVVSTGGQFGSTLTLGQTWSAGRKVSMTYPSGNVVTYQYDGDNVAAVKVNGTTVLSNVTYDPMGPVTGWQSAAGGYARTFDTAGRIATHTQELGQRTLSWDASNRVESITNANGVVWTYGYDGLNRLSSGVEAPTAQKTYSFDGSHNRTAALEEGTNYSYGVDGASNRLTSATAPGLALSYQFDAGGRIIGDGARTFGWSNAGQLTTATNGAQTAVYSYNGQGQRVRKVVGGAARHFLYDDDGVSLLGEYAQSGPTAQVTALNEIVYLDGLPVLVLRGSSVYFIQPDHLGTPRLIKDGAGTVVWRWASDPYGKGDPDQNPGGVSLFEFNSRMPGQQFDAETGLFYNNARYYDPVVGRYISSDPIGLAGGLNTYGYAYQSPTVHTDPTGKYVFLFIRGAVLAAHSYRATRIAVALAEAGSGVSYAPVVSGGAGVGIAGAAVARHLFGKVADGAAPYCAKLGASADDLYRQRFFSANQQVDPTTWVHHAIERTAAGRYPGTITASELHSLENLRGIPLSVNARTHLSSIRHEWTDFYKTHPVATRQQLLDKATEIDLKYGHLFNPQVGQ